MTDLTAALYDIDEAYLQHWADELGMRDQLTKALGEISR